MFCTLIYFDYVKFLQYKQSGSKIKTVEDYEPNKILYFNPNCHLQLVLEYICRKASLSPECEYDFINEHGECVGIKDYKLAVNGLVVFSPRTTYVLLLSQKSGLNVEKMVPLLNQQSPEYSRMRKIMLKKQRSAQKDLRRRTTSKVSLTPTSSLSRQSVTGKKQFSAKF